MRDDIVVRAGALLHTDCDHDAVQAILKTSLVRRILAYNSNVLLESSSGSGTGADLLQMYKLRGMLHSWVVLLTRR